LFAEGPHEARYNGTAPRRSVPVTPLGHRTGGEGCNGAPCENPPHRRLHRSRASRRAPNVFPFMTVVDEVMRIPSPVSSDFLVEMIENPREPVPASPVVFGSDPSPCRIVPLLPDNIEMTLLLCTYGVTHEARRGKILWALDLSRKSGQSVLGLGAVHRGRFRGAVEFMPSHLVPYPLSFKDPSTAFVTCIYPTEQDFDYRSPVLDGLLEHLVSKGY